MNRIYQEIVNMPEEIVRELCGNNPTVMLNLIEVYNKVPEIDPDNAMGGNSVLYLLDSYQIYDNDIYVLFKDVCAQDPALFLAVLKSVSLKELELERLKERLKKLHPVSPAEELPVQQLYARVVHRYPRFNKR